MTDNLPSVPQDPPLISNIETLDDQLSALDQHIASEEGVIIHAKLTIEQAAARIRLYKGERQRIRARKRIAALAAFKLKQVDEH